MAASGNSRLARPPHCPSLATSRIASNRRTFSSRYGAASRIVEDVMRLELRYRSDIDLSQPAMQVEIRSHIARCLRDYLQGGEGVITLAGVEHCFVIGAARLPRAGPQRASAKHA
jgi:hypothetical protein